MANVEMGRDYTLLAETLMTYPFGDGVMVGNDENRAVDGLSLRDEFESSYGELDISTDEPCSMLEMMVALAIRAADLMYDSGCPDTPKYYFDVMIGNLGLEKMTNFAENCVEKKEFYVTAEILLTEKHKIKKSNYEKSSASKG